MRREQLQLTNKVGRKFNLVFYGLENLNPKEEAKRPLMLIFPGGYFAHHSAKEVDPVVSAFLNQGFQVGVVYYNLATDAGDVYPDAALSGIEAIDYFRQHARQYQVNPTKIYTIGFSAGGHVAAIINSMLDSKEMIGAYNLTDQMKPTATLLVYPFIDIEKLGFELSPEQLASIPENPLFHNATTGVTEKTPPTFVIHAVNDPVVPVSNGLDYFIALKEHGVQTEGLFLDAAVHGFSLATPEIGLAGNTELVDIHLSHWFQMAIEWLKRM